MEKIRIRLQSFDHRLLDQSVKDIVVKAKRTGASVAGPIPLPTRIHKFCVLRSPHVDKKSREHFEMRIHKRLIDISEYNNETIEPRFRRTTSSASSSSRARATPT